MILFNQTSNHSLNYELTLNVVINMIHSLMKTSNHPQNRDLFKWVPKVLHNLQLAPCLRYLYFLMENIRFSSNSCLLISQSTQLEGVY
jgi:hypothetical protein